MVLNHPDRLRKSVKGEALKRKIGIMLFLLALAGGSKCHAGGVCDDWVKRGGYCVDYVKSRIPSFPVPKDVSEIALLSNKTIRDVAEGDVAIFNLGTYWHVAYIEKVNPDQQGIPATIDVSEMNYGDRLTLDDYLKEWRLKKTSEWERAVSCGVTIRYGDIDRRSNIPISSIQQIWSPVVAASREGSGARTLLDRVRYAFEQYLQVTGAEL